MFKAADTIMWGEYLIWRIYKIAKSLFEELGGRYQRQAGRLSCQHSQAGNGRQRDSAAFVVNINLRS